MEGLQDDRADGPWLRAQDCDSQAPISDHQARHGILGPEARSGFVARQLPSASSSSTRQRRTRGVARTHNWLITLPGFRASVGTHLIVCQRRVLRECPELGPIRQRYALTIRRAVGTVVLNECTFLITGLLEYREARVHRLQ